MKILIVDDEAPARTRLRQLVEDDDQHSVVGEASNGQEALNKVAQDQPDVVLLDIRMPGIDGIETAHHLNQLDTPPAIVFTTAYDEYAIDAFDANAIGYVLKPVRREKLRKALDLAARLSTDTLRDIGNNADDAKPRQHVCAKSHGALKLIPVADIHCFVADQKYVSVAHSGGQDLIDDSLKLLESEFADQFVRIHRSALVAISAIDALKKTEDGRTQVILRESVVCGAGDAPDELIVSRRHVADVKRRIKRG